MTFKKTAMCLALALALPVSSPVFAQDADYVPPADEMSVAMEIMDAMFPPATREETMLQVATSMGTQAAQGMMTGPIFEEPGIRAIVDQFLADLPETMRPAISRHLPSLINATAIAYTREFSLAELQDIRAFATTPSGQRYFASIQPLLNDPAVAEANMVFFQDVSALSQEQSKMVEQEVIQYLQDNPDVVERLQAAGVGG